MESTKRGETLTTKEESNTAKTTARYASWCVPFILPSAGAAFRSSLAPMLQNLCFKSSKADPQVWLRKAAKDDGFDIAKCCLNMSTTSEPWIIATRTQSVKVNRRILLDEDGSVTPKLYSSVGVDTTQLPDGHDKVTNRRSTSRTHSTRSS